MSRQWFGVFVCAFDPIHSGHLEAARRAAESSGAGGVFLVPWTGSAPMKDRLMMLTAAAGGDRRLIPFAPEFTPDQDALPDLVRAVRRRCPDSDLSLMVPAGLFPDASLSALRGRGLRAIVLPSGGDLSSAALRKELSGKDLSEGRLPASLPVPVAEYVACRGLYGVPSRVPESGPWIDALFAALKPHRFSHSLAVAYTARELALRFGEDPLLAEKAGLLHDCAKNLPLKEMRALVEEAGISLDRETLESTALLHSVAGACLARKAYGVEDPVILEAMSYHNTGYPGMTRLAMCVCLGDSIEPTRSPYPLLSEVRGLAETSLEKALLRSLEGTAAYVRAGKGSVHPRTLETVSWLKTLPAAR